MSDHICQFCRRCPDEDGFSTTYDINNCPIAFGIMYHDDDNSSPAFKSYGRFKCKVLANSLTGNDREATDVLCPEKGVVFKTVDNGGGYDIVKCPGFRVNYPKYMASRHWKEKRTIRIMLDGKVCQNCGSAINLQVHHLTYENIPNEDMMDLVTLCKTCHEKLHAVDIEKKKF